MISQREGYDVLIIGAGPAGLACAIEARRHKLRYLVIEKGCLVNSIFHFPTNLTMFSTPDLLEIGNVPFITATEKPTREDLLKYYRRVMQHFDLAVNLFETVQSVDGRYPEFGVRTSKARYRTKRVVVATGQYDNPNRLNIPGEDLPKVSHYYTEGHPFFRRKVAVIGGKNSAVEFALDLYKHGAEVTIIHRGPTFGDSVKYWLLPDIQNRIKEGRIGARFNTTVQEIKEDVLILQTKDGYRETLENDFVFAMTGYRPDVRFFERLGMEVDADAKPVHDPETLETNVPGLYIAGVVTAGAEGSKVFIENSRNHGKKIIGHILHGKERSAV